MASGYMPQRAGWRMGCEPRAARDSCVGDFSKAVDCGGTGANGREGGPGSSSSVHGPGRGPKRGWPGLSVHGGPAEVVGLVLERAQARPPAPPLAPAWRLSPATGAAGLPPEPKSFGFRGGRMSARPSSGLIVRPRAGPSPVRGTIVPESCSNGAPCCRSRAQIGGRSQAKVRRAR